MHTMMWMTVFGMIGRRHYLLGRCRIILRTTARVLLCIISFAFSGAAAAAIVVAVVAVAIVVVVVVIIEKCHLATTLVATIIASVLLMVRTRIISEMTKKERKR